MTDLAAMQPGDPHARPGNHPTSDQGETEMTTATDPLAGWDVCSVTGCPLSDPNAPEPDDIDEIEETGVAHGVQHVNISDHWWVRANTNERVLAAADWLARHEGRDYCIRSAEHAGEWNGYQLLASDLLRAVDGSQP